ncbi:GNAT family N-acetyltransferase [Amycolatopsis rhabdoformis]|uniref:GNAT family N-acetyltransferase n=1 Tax=Amycolatopsis rhabdoformis TaxID=1448059 RepID=A0ABZ1I6Q1_9PSEU|nr:GNAT family N-acetyltransferase [Amycolatopsis rhabdoformis]WSE30106.1 GNAT family N-acetyltransferase [Amycolatopsis rhabdoformis]
MRDLVAPATRLHRAWLEAHAEWGPGLHEDGFGLDPTDDVVSPAGFAAFVARLTGEAPHVIYRWLVEDGQVLGGIALRHGPADHVSWAGHLGFGIRPTARRRALAAWALRGMLDEARAGGLDRVLLVCEPGNSASAKTIERAGGVFETTQDTRFGPLQRYWLDLAEPAG